MWSVLPDSIGNVFVRLATVSFCCRAHGMVAQLKLVRRALRLLAPVRNGRGSRRSLALMHPSWYVAFGVSLTYPLADSSLSTGLCFLLSDACN